MSAIKSVSELPEVSFIENISLDKVRSQLVADYSAKYKELTGNNVDLPKDDVNRLILGVCALQIYQAYQYIEQAGRCNLLKYAYGDYLDNLAAMKNVTRKTPASSTVIVRFYRSDNADSLLTIPAGTRVTTEKYNVYWSTPQNADITIPIGNKYIDIECICTEPGSFSNGFEIEEIKELVDPVPYISEVCNISASSGGCNDESDDDFKQRILLAPSAYSTAGTVDSYIYFIKMFDDNISDVKVKTDGDANVLIYVLKKEGYSAPSPNEIENIQKYIDTSDFKPLTDKVTVKSPTSTTYNIDLVYYIRKINENKELTIKKAIENAIIEYTNEQRSELGKDINPSLLIQKIMNAGASRVVVNSPQYKRVDETSYSLLTSLNTRYGGLE